MTSELSNVLFACFSQGIGNSISHEEIHGASETPKTEGLPCEEALACGTMMKWIQRTLSGRQCFHDGALLHSFLVYSLRSW